ncbi:PASTA domain-containing protein [bacterium]|nr:PASTA domain-containing protein [bacterium]
MGTRKKQQSSSDISSPPGLFGTLWRLVIVGVLLFGLAGVSGYATVRYLIQQPELQAPDLLTLDLRQATVHASQLGFSTRIAGEESSEVLDEGFVLAQRPSPGTWVKPGSTILLTIAR